MHITRQSFAASCALLVSACAPSLSSQISSVRSLAKMSGLPELHEGAVDPGSAPNVARLLEQPIDADAAVRIALLNNRELRARLRELGIPASELVSAGTIANPSVELELLPERDSKYELRVEYDLTSLLMAPLRRSAARDELEAARLTLAGEVIQLGYDVRTRFYALQASQQRLNLGQQSLETLAAARDAAQALVDAGNIRMLDAASEIAAYERARVDVAMLELELAERREDMQRLLGLHGEQTRWEMQGALPDAPEKLSIAEDLERSTVEANLDLRAGDQRLRGLSKQTGIARTEGWLPEVVADVHALRVEGEPPGSGEDEWRWGAGVSLEVPLFDRGQGRLQSLESRFDAAAERYHGLAVEVRSAARDARNRLTSSQARARQYGTVIVPAQRTVLEQTVLQYNAMQLGIFELLVARRQLLDVELAYVDTLRDYWTARAEVEALTRGRVVRAADLSRSTPLQSATASEGGH